MAPLAYTSMTASLLLQKVGGVGIESVNFIVRWVGKQFPKELVI